MKRLIEKSALNPLSSDKICQLENLLPRYTHNLPLSLSLYIYIYIYIYIYVCVCVFICKSHSKSSKPFPKFKFAAHPSASYWPHLYGNYNRNLYYFFSFIRSSSVLPQQKFSARILLSRQGLELFEQSFSHSLSFYIYIYIYIYKEKVKLATVVEVDSKAPFSIATTPRCREGHNSVPSIALLYP